MESKSKEKIRRLLVIGLLASLVTVLGGELPIGWVEYPVVENDPAGFMGMLMGSAGLKLWQLSCGVLFGGIGIALQYFGFEAAARIVEQGGSRKSAKLIHIGAAATAGLGGLVHVLCVALMFLCRTAELTAGALPQPLADFTLWLLLPVCAVFMPIYYAMTVALFLAVIRGKTFMPRWAALFNPLTATLLLNFLPLLLPGSAFINALGMANMGIGSVLCFGGMLVLLEKAE